MAENDLPEYYYKIPINDEVFSTFLSNKLEDFNIHVNPKEALEIFYNISINIMYFLYMHPGSYFKLGHFDIDFDENDWCHIKRPQEATEDTLTIDYLYKRFCSQEKLKEDLRKNLDLFAQAILGTQEEKKKEVQTLSNLISQRKSRLQEIDKLNKTKKNLTQRQKEALERRKKDLATLNRGNKIQEMKLFVNQCDKNQLTLDNERYEKLKTELRKKWEQNKNDFPLK